MGYSGSNGLSTVLPNCGGSFGVHSPDTSQSLVQHSQITLSSAQILAMYVTPVQLIPAPATGLSIVVDRWRLRMIASATAYASGGAVNIQYGNTGSGGGTALGGTAAAALVTTATPGTVDSQISLGASTQTLTQASGVFITNATGAFTTGTGTAVIDIWFAIN
jgi:hypothetical protein